MSVDGVIPTEHGGWSIEIENGKGAYGPETVMVIGKRGEEKIFAVAWTAPLAWASLLDMIRQRSKTNSEVPSDKSNNP